jgi:hypothetical protein
VELFVQQRGQLQGAGLQTVVEQLVDLLVDRQAGGDGHGQGHQQAAQAGDEQHAPGHRGGPLDRPRRGLKRHGRS